MCDTELLHGDPKTLIHITIKKKFKGDSFLASHNTQNRPILMSGSCTFQKSQELVFLFQKELPGSLLNWALVFLHCTLYFTNNHSNLTHSSNVSILC